MQAFFRASQGLKSTTRMGLDVLSAVSGAAFFTRAAIALGLGILLLPFGSLQAQLINVQSPFSRTGDSFWNRTGVGFGMQFPGNSRIQGLNAAGQLTPNIGITQGSAAAALPPFGGYDPNSGLYTGIIGGGGDFGFSLGVFAGKGNTRTNVTRSPSVTMFNGQSGSIFSGETRPFVTGFTPVVGNSTGVGLLPLQIPADIGVYRERPPLQGSFGPAPNAQSTATEAPRSLAEIERGRAFGVMAEQAALEESIVEDWEAAKSAVAEGAYGAARAKYRRILRRLAEVEATSDLREQISGELQAIADKR